MLRFLRLLLLVFVCSDTPAQVLQPYLHYKLFTTKDGLPTNFCRATVEDSRGFLWIATQAGLVRFDGKSFVNFYKKNAAPNELASRNLTSLRIIDNHLYCSGFNGISKVNLETYKATNYEHYAKGDSMKPWTEAFTVYKDRNGRIWAGSNIDGPMVYNAKKDRFETSSLPPDAAFQRTDWCTNFYETAEGDLIYNCLQGMVKLSKNGTYRCYPYPPFPDKRNLNRSFILVGLFDNPDVIGISTDDFGIYKFNHVTGQYKNILDAETNSPIVAKCSKSIHQQKTLAFQSIYHFDEKAETIKKVKSNYPPITECYDVCITKDSMAWFSTQFGLYRLNLSPTTVAKHIFYQEFKDGVADMDTNAAILRFMDQYGKHTLSELDVVSGEKSIPFKGESKRTMRVPKQLKKIGETLYIATFNGLWKLDKGSSRPIAIEEPKELINLYTTCNLDVYKHYLLVCGVPNGPLLYNTVNKKYYLFKQALNTKHSSNADYIPACFDRYGNIYIARVRDNQVLKFDTNGKLLSQQAIPLKIPKTPIISSNIELDNEENIWLASKKKGVIKYEKKQNKWIELFDENSFNVFSNVDYLLYDDDRTVYTSSTEGLYAIDIFTNQVTQLNNVYELSNSASNIYELKLINKGHVLANAGDGNFYILQGTQSHTAANPFLFVEKVRIMDSVRHTFLQPNEKIILNAKENAFSVNFGVAFPPGSENVQYEAMLEGIDKNWRRLGTLQEISFVGLNPGRYTLKLKASSGSNAFENTIRSIPVVVKAAWYQTLLFKLLAFIGIAALIGIAVRNHYLRQLSLQKSALEKQMLLAQERNRIAADMHDDLGAGLSQIRYLSNEALSHANSKELKEVLEKAKYNSDKLVDNVNDIIWSLNNDEKNLQQLFYFMRGQFAELLQTRNIIFNADVSQDLSKIELNSLQSRNLYLVCKEAIHNAIKHSEATSISMSLMIKQNQVKLVIKDNGKGFNVQEAELRGNGLGNYFKRMQALNGTVDINSTDKGTIIQFSFPL